jgi:hypothetical protein
MGYPPPPRRSHALQLNPYCICHDSRAFWQSIYLHYALLQHQTERSKASRAQHVQLLGPVDRRLKQKACDVRSLYIRRQVSLKPAGAFLTIAHRRVYCTSPLEILTQQQLQHSPSLVKWTDLGPSDDVKQA